MKKPSRWEGFPIILLLVSALLMLAVLNSCEAADNDGLAFETINAPINEKVRKCYTFGKINTYEYESVKYWPKSEINSCTDVKLIVSDPISVNACLKAGIYDQYMADRIASNPKLGTIDAATFSDLGNYCQHAYEELYPQYRYREDNAKIREATKWN